MVRCTCKPNGARCRQPEIGLAGGWERICISVGVFENAGIIPRSFCISRRFRFCNCRCSYSAPLTPPATFHFLNTSNFFRNNAPCSARSLNIFRSTIYTSRERGTTGRRNEEAREAVCTGKGRGAMNDEEGKANSEKVVISVCFTIS